MDMKNTIEEVRADLRERPNSHFSEVCLRVRKNKVSLTELHNAFYELLKRDEIAGTNGKWRLLEERRKAS
jgi:hypothetical protein